MKIIKEYIGYCTEGGSDKEYRIQILEDRTLGYPRYDLYVLYGKRGRASNESSKGLFVRLEDAMLEANKLQKSKEKKHYKFTNNITSPIASSISPTISAKVDTGFRPILQIPIEMDRVLELCKDPYFFAQKKYDGKHLIVCKQNDGKLIFANKLGFQTTAPSWLIDNLEEMDPCIISGELLNEAYVAFDILQDRDIDVRNLSYEKRLEHLSNLVDPASNYIFMIETAKTTEEKLKLIEQVNNDKAEGWIFKNRHSPYQAGRKHGMQFKYKRWKSATVKVLGHNVDVRSIRVVINQEDKEVIVGDITVKANQSIPPINSFVEVKYLNYQNGGRLIQPELLRERTDVTWEDCSIEQLEGLMPDTISPTRKFE